MAKKEENPIDTLKGLTIPVGIMVHVLGAYIIALIRIVRIN
jgi:hypothetical protein